jgi:hypothetical protein
MLETEERQHKRINSARDKNVFVLRMGFVEYMQQYLFEEEECITLCQNLSTLKEPKSINVTCLKFFYM